MPTWLASFLSAAAGAFFAAWAGAQLGFRRVKKERALERRISWHEETIQALAKYEERLDRVHKHSRNAIIVQQVKRGVPSSGSADLPKTFKVQAALWSELGIAEERARAALRLGDLYTDLETQVACSSALSSTVNVVASQWVDITPEPEIGWVELHSKMISTGSLRLKIQESQKRVLELDGYLASVLPSYGRWKTLRRIQKMQKALTKLSSQALQVDKRPE